MTTIWHPEWRDYQAPTKYPFEDDATLLSDRGQAIQPDLFLDAAFYCSGARELGRLSRIVVTGDLVTLEVGDDYSDSRAIGQFDMLDPPDHIRFVDTDGRPAGILVSEASRLLAFQSWVTGEHLFSREQAGLVAAVWMPMPAVGVSGIQADDGKILTGDVYLVGEAGVQLSCDQVTLPATCELAERPAYVVRVDIQGDPLWRRRACAPGFFVTPRFLEQITFQKGTRTYVCGPGNFGDIKLHVGNGQSSDTILRIRPEVDGLRIEAVGESLENLR